MARKFLFMRCICIWLGKVARAWIWQQTIIKCGDNEWGYPSKPLHVYWAFKGPSRRKLRTISTKTEFKCRTLKVKHDVGHFLTFLYTQFSSSCKILAWFQTIWWYSSEACWVNRDLSKQPSKFCLCSLSRMSSGLSVEDLLAWFSQENF
jgi:hypothetical protein